MEDLGQNNAINSDNSECLVKITPFLLQNWRILLFESSEKNVNSGQILAHWGLWFQLLLLLVLLPVQSREQERGSRLYHELWSAWLRRRLDRLRTPGWDANSSSSPLYLATHQEPLNVVTLGGKKSQSGEGFFVLLLDDHLRKGGFFSDQLLTVSGTRTHI